MILPLNTNPPVRCFQDRAFPLCILMANYPKDIDEWFCSHYFHACYNATTGENFDLFHEDKWFTKEGAIIGKIINPMGKFEVGTIIDMLADGYYIYGKWDEYYIPEKISYKRKHKEHDFLLYGYNEIGNTFETIGYVQNGSFKPFVVSYENYAKSIVSLPQEHFYLRAYKYDFRYNYTLSIENFKKNLSNYLNGTNLFSNINVDNYPFGIETWSRLISFMAEQVERKEDLDERYSRCYWEYKILMNRRMHFLAGNNLIPGLIASQYAEIERVAQRLFLLSIKYNMNKKREIFNEELKQMRTNQEKEHHILTTVLEIL